MAEWLESVYSDGSEFFAAPAIPSIGDTVHIRIRMYADAPVKHVILRYLLNGVERLEKMQPEEREGWLRYYGCNVVIREKVFAYQFYLVCADRIYYYTQKEITSYIPDHTYDFRLLAGYEQSAWVKGAVFYQIFPDRFCNGNPDNDVRTGEYMFNGYATMKIEDWNRPAPFYGEGHCLDFYGGDLEGVRRKIPYLKELGINAVYLNPIFYAATVHRYDCLDYFQVDPHLGGGRALQELSRELHENGMKLILDVSINHTGTAHKWFNKEGLFFDRSMGAYHNPDAEERGYYFFGEGADEYLCWAGVDTLPTLNYTSGRLRDILYRREDSLLKKWLKAPYDIDGWRFDVADVMARNNELQLAHEVWPEIRKSIKEEKEDAYILAEDWGDCAEYLRGNEWDSPMNYFGCARPVRQFVGEVDLFHAHMEELRQVHYRPSAKDTAERIREHLMKLPFCIRQVQFNLLDSHDTPRLHNNPEISEAAYQCALLLLFTLPGAASIYYGDEAGICGRTEDVEGCRYPMPWDKDFKREASYYLYHTLSMLRQGNPAFSDGGFQFFHEQGRVLGYARFYGGEVYLTVCSMDESGQEVRLPLKAYGKDRLSSDRDCLGQELKILSDVGGEAVIRVGANESFLIKV